MFSAILLRLKMDGRRRSMQQRHRINISVEASTSSARTRIRTRRSQRSRSESNSDEESTEDLPPVNNVSDTESMDTNSSTDDSTETLSDTDSRSTSPILSGSERTRRSASVYRTRSYRRFQSLRVSESEESRGDSDFAQRSSNENSRDATTEPHSDLNSPIVFSSEEETQPSPHSSNEQNNASPISRSSSELTLISPEDSRSFTDISPPPSILGGVSPYHMRSPSRSPTPMPSPREFEMLESPSSVQSFTSSHASSSRTGGSGATHPLNDQIPVVPIFFPSPIVNEPTASSSTVEVNNVATSESNLNLSSNDDDGMTCPICFESWSNSGEHRMASLKCGHIFGKNCIERWLRSASKCPSCNSKGTKRDIRVLYARNLKAIDTSEKDRLAQELQRFKSKVQTLELEKARMIMKSELDAQQMRKFQEELRLLKNSISDPGHLAGIAEFASGNKKLNRFRLARHISFEMTKEGSTRVMAFNEWMCMLVVSVPTQMPLFPGFGVRKINVMDMKMEKYVALHSKPIRDLCFNPSRQDLLLSVSLDKSAKILNISSNSVVNTYVTSQPLWCCCWNSENTAEFFVGSGSGNGSVFAFDTNSSINEPTKTFTISGTGPIVSLSYITGTPEDQHHSGLLITRLNSISFLELRPAGLKEHELRLEGPFVHTAFDAASRHILVTCRPKPNQRQAHARHIVCRLHAVNISDDAASVNMTVSVLEVHCLQGGTTMRILPRASLTTHPNSPETTIAIFSEESSQTSKIYDISTPQLLQKLVTNNNIIDCLTVKGHDRHYLALLSEKMVLFYKWVSHDF